MERFLEVFYQNEKKNAKVRFKELKIIWYYISISTFLVELHLDDVHKVPLVVGVEFQSYETFI